MTPSTRSHVLSIAHSYGLTQIPRIGRGWQEDDPRWALVGQLLSRTYAASATHFGSPHGMYVRYGTWDARTGTWAFPPLARFTCQCGYHTSAAGDRVPAFIATEGARHAEQCPGRGKAADIRSAGALDERSVA